MVYIYFIFLNSLASVADDGIMFLVEKLIRKNELPKAPYSLPAKTVQAVY